MSQSMNRRQFVSRGAAAGAALAFANASAAGESSNDVSISRIYKLEELAWPQIAAFNREMLAPTWSVTCWCTPARIRFGSRR